MLILGLVSFNQASNHWAVFVAATIFAMAVPISMPP